jgi:hypothetical protein
LLAAIIMTFLLGIIESLSVPFYGSISLFVDGIQYV